MTQLALKEKTMEELKEHRSKILNEFLLITEDIEKKLRKFYDPDDGRGTIFAGEDEATNTIYFVAISSQKIADMLENLSSIRNEENPLQIFNQLLLTPSTQWKNFLQCKGALRKIESLCAEDSKIETALANIK